MLGSRDDAVAAATARFEAALQAITPRQGRFERLFRAGFAAWARICAWRISVRGMGRLPRSRCRPAAAGCIVAAAPHRAWIEPFLLLAAWPPEAARLVWLADSRTLTRSWWRRRLLPRLGVIPVGQRGPRDYANIAAAALERGLAVAVFPEKGPPSPPDRPRTISPGFAYIARHTGAPVVPVVVGGSHRICRGSTFTIDVLPAIDPGQAAEDAFTPEGRRPAHELARGYESLVAGILPERTAQVDAQRPERERWTWLATLFD